MQTPEGLPIQKVSVAQPFEWVGQAARFYTAHVGSILLVLLVQILVTSAFSAVPGIGTILSNVVSSLLAYGMIRYYVELESGRTPNLRTLFSVIDDSEATKSILFMFMVSILCFLFSFVLFLIAGAVMMYTQGISMSEFQDKDSILNFLTSHIGQLIFLLGILLVPITLLIGAFYFVIPLITLRKLPFMDALRSSFEATLINWWPFLVFESVLALLGLLITGSIIFVAFGADPSTRMVALGIGGLVAIFFGFFILPILSLFPYVAYLNIFENRQIKTAAEKFPAAVQV